MKVKRIVANIATSQLADAYSFYHDVLGLDVVMDHGWIMTYGSSESMNVQLNIASQGGSQTATPHLSIEVDDVEEAYRRMQEAGYRIEYGPVNEPWGVRRFYVRDPFDKLINIVAHIESEE